MSRLREDVRMNKPAYRILCVIIVVSLMFSVSSAQEFKSIKLPDPQIDGGRPLMQVLKDRKTSRDFRGAKLPLQTLSNMLWAGFGINRPESGRRTAPSAVNWQEIDIYVAGENGLFLYDEENHTLVPVVAQDLRADTGTQSFVKDAPINLVYVADLSKMGSGTDTQKERTAWADTGFISQNVYLYCASEGLATVVRGLVDRDALAPKMKLRPDQRITLTQTVGYPKQ